MVVNVFLTDPCRLAVFVAKGGLQWHREGSPPPPGDPGALGPPNVQLTKIVSGLFRTGFCFSGTAVFLSPSTRYGYNFANNYVEGGGVLLSCGRAP
jgi:hypothetical protein